VLDRGLAERLYRIRARTVIVWGEDDRMIPRYMAKHFAAESPAPSSSRFPPPREDGPQDPFAGLGGSRGWLHSRGRSSASASNAARSSSERRPAARRARCESRLPAVRPPRGVHSTEVQVRRPLVGYRGRPHQIAGAIMSCWSLQVATARAAGATRNARAGPRMRASHDGPVLRGRIPHQSGFSQRYPVPPP
jgi:hypothetical protein